MLCLIAAAPAIAQDQSEVNSATFSKAPYRVGERLTYNVAFAAFPSAAHVELWIAGHGVYFNQQGTQLRAHAETTGIVNAALFSFNGDYIAYVKPETGEPYRTQQFRREAGRTDDISREFNKAAGTEAIPSRLRTGGLPGTFDIPSALYRARALPLQNGARYSITLNINDVLYLTDLKVVGREIVKTNVGSFSTIVTQLRFPKNSDINSYGIQIYFSDDDRHVPVLLTAKHPAGEIRAELAGSELPGETPAPVDVMSPEVAASQPQVQPAPNPGNDVPSGIPGIPNVSASPNRETPGVPPGNTTIPTPTTPVEKSIPNNASPGKAAPNPISPGKTTPNPITPGNTTPRSIVTPGRPNSGIGAPGLTAPATTPTTLPAGLPFAAGEQLNFNIYLENGSQSVGLASFQVRARSKYFGRDGLMLTGKAQTTGTAQSILPADDLITTYVDPNTLLPFRSEMSLQESRRHLNQTVLFDQDRGNATAEGGARMEVPVGTYDLLSAFYALRSFNLKSPKPNAVSLLINNRARTLFITFLKRETIELGGQQIPAIQLSLTTDDPEPDSNGLRLWVSEDQRRLPLRITAITPSGKVRGDLAILPIVRQ